MIVVEINSCNYGSTGRIMLGIAECARSNGVECYTVCPKGRSMKPINSKYHHYLGSLVGRNIHRLFSHYFGLNGFFSILDTVLFLGWINKIKPNIIHLHNLHDSYINLPLLFRYIKFKNIRVIWTLHDCWAFTGRCPYFTSLNCNNWKENCSNCSYPSNSYPPSKINNSHYLYNKKKKWFTGIDDLTIVTPSLWLKNLVKESFLSSYNSIVLNNGIDSSVFHPTDNIFREEYKLQHKKLLLGVASPWDKRKGFDIFIALSKMLNPNYTVILVGLNDSQRNNLPKNIIGIGRVDNANDLADIYSSCDIFINPTLEDNYPTVNMESIACGTPVITFPTGGSGEMIDCSCGLIASDYSINAILDCINQIFSNYNYYSNGCLSYMKSFDERKRYKEYLDLYLK